MNELDVAMLIILNLGLWGLRIEPWSPHPPLMATIGGLYFCARCAAYIVISKFRKKEGRQTTWIRKTW